MTAKSKNPFNAARRKGGTAFRDGKSRHSNPYKDKRGGYKNMVTFSAAWRRAWFEGFDEAALAASKYPGHFYRRTKL